MSRLTTIRPEEATGAAAEVFAKIKKAVGKVPNAYATVGTHSPEALGAALAFDAAVAASTLGKADIEVIKLAVNTWAVTTVSPRIRCWASSPGCRAMT